MTMIGLALFRGKRNADIKALLFEQGVSEKDTVLVLLYLVAFAPPLSLKTRQDSLHSSDTHTQIPDSNWLSRTSSPGPRSLNLDLLFAMEETNERVAHTGCHGCHSM